MEPVYIGLGSNLGDSLTYLQHAVDALARLPETQLLRASSLYSSAPLGPVKQPRYLNAVILLNTALQPLELLDALQSIEKEQGRVRQGERWGPRTLDLDIILFGLRRIDEPRLHVPHCHMQARAFVLYPLAELCSADFKLPDGRALTDLLEQCSADPTLQRLEQRLIIG